VQLFNGWDRSKGQPLYTPFAISLLERALAAKGVAWCQSVAPGGAGLTAVVYADREPFASWAAHLAGFGCQVRAWRVGGLEGGWSDGGGLVGLMMWVGLGWSGVAWVSRGSDGRLDG